MLINIANSDGLIMAIETVKKIRANKGSVKKHINLDPKMEGPDVPQHTVNEAKKDERHAVIAFTDANPPTEGHYHLANTVRYHASKVQGDPMLFLSHKENRRTHPLPYSQKFKIAQDAFGSDLVHNTRHEDLEGVIGSLHGRYHHVTVVTNQGEHAELRAALKKKNGRGFNFKSMNFVSAGKKNPDKAGAAKVHGKAMRDAALQDDSDTFTLGLPKALHKHKDAVYSNVRRGLGIREQINEQFDLFITEIINSTYSSV